MPWGDDGLYSESNPGARTWGGIAGVLGAGLEGFMQADTQRRGEWREKQKEERANAQNQLALAMQMGDPGAFRGAYQKAFAPEGQYENNIARTWRQTFGGPQQAPQMAQVPGGYGDYFKRMQEDRAAQIAERQRAADMATRTMSLQEAQETRQLQEMNALAAYRKQSLEAQAAQEAATLRLAGQRLGQESQQFHESLGLDRAKLGLTKEEMALKRSQSEWTNVGDALVNWRTGDVRYQKPETPTYLFDAKSNQVIPVMGKWGGTINEPIREWDPASRRYVTVGWGDTARHGGKPAKESSAFDMGALRDEFAGKPAAKKPDVASPAPQPPVVLPPQPRVTPPPPKSRAPKPATKKPKPSVTPRGVERARSLTP